MLSLCLAAALLLSVPAQGCGTDSRDDEGTVRIAVVSDIHFSLRSDASIYPLMERIGDLVNTLADEVIARRPDALILCGDNTNSGRESDESALCAVLRRIAEAGIPVIAVTGNHDFDLGSPEQFLRSYAGLCTAETRDEASLSFRTHVGPVCILAMDDNYATRGRSVRFSEATMHWLENELREASEKSETVLFVSHHNVLPGGEDASDSAYMIQNPELRDLLGRYGVRLCLSGHRHSQEILNHTSLYEIVSAMPVAAPHLFGWITIGDDHLSYQAETIDFASYGGPYGLTDISDYDRYRSQSFREMLERQTDWELLDPATQERVLELFWMFMEAYGRGSIHEVREEILNDPCYQDFLQVFYATNYGPWMAAVLISDPLPGNKLEIDL